MDKPDEPIHAPPRPQLAGSEHPSLDPGTCSRERKREGGSTSRDLL
jgi:hypothetical protein